ncbi:DUF397 domain-containing protein [Nonomuraea sp. NPDC023979]|uniref:DUF397 domain-containing protein n=1 Tax=Nonomuraea sp. NPDC023979 TaxID=3154796 RepID=UPI0033E00CB0
MNDLSNAEFRKSSYSGSGNNCVEVATNLPGVVAVRDSKDPQGGVLVLSPAAFRDLTARIKNGDFDNLL